MKREDTLEIPCKGGTIIAMEDGDGVRVIWRTPDGRTKDEQRIALSDGKLMVVETHVENLDS